MLGRTTTLEPLGLATRAVPTWTPAGGFGAGLTAAAGRTVLAGLACPAAADAGTAAAAPRPATSTSRLRARRARPRSFAVLKVFTNSPLHQGMHTAAQD